MSERDPGSKEWWLETAMIAMGGLALAIWLWDGPVFGGDDIYVRVPAQTIDGRPATMADLFDAGCVTAEMLRALVDGHGVTIDCPAVFGDAPATRQFQ